MKVRDPDGQVWRVSRRWLPWRQRVRSGWDVPSLDLPGTDLGGDLAAVGLLIVVLVVLLVVVPVVAVALLVSLELLLLLLVLPFAVLGRVLLGRRWTVELRRGWRPWWEEQVGDWQATTLRIHQVADAVGRGEPPARSLGSPPEARGPRSSRRSAFTSSPRGRHARR